MTGSATHALLERLIGADRQLRVLNGLEPLPGAESLKDALDNSVNTVAQLMGREDIGQRAAELISESLDLQWKAQQSISGALVGGANHLTGAVRRLSSLGGGANLVRQMCVEVIDTGAFDLATFSVVDEAGWEALVELPRGPAYQGELSPPLRLKWDETAAERHCVQSREVVVTGEVWPASAAVAGHFDVADYIVAPIIAEFEVVGLLHAARRRPMVVDNDVAALAGALASTFGAAYERESWSHRMWTHRQIVSARIVRLIQDGEDVLGKELEIDSSGVDPPADIHQRLDSESSSKLDSLLTPREAEVMHLIAGGASNAEIANKLFIGLETVKSHVKSILRKLRAVNRSEAISRYLDHN